jgi:hypothetical protein
MTVAMLEKLSEYFYDPLVFWAAPLVLVALVAGWRRVRARGILHLSGPPPGNGPDDPLKPGEES